MTSKMGTKLQNCNGQPFQVKKQSPAANRKNLREILKPANILINDQTRPTLPKQGPLSTHVPNLHIPSHDAFNSAPDSSMSSPCRSPMRVFGHELIMNTGVWAGKPYPDITLFGSGHCSSPGSSQNSGHNSVGRDMAGQNFWPHSRCSPECSPIRSPRMIIPGPSSRIHSGAVTPPQPRYGLMAMEMPANCSDEKKQQSYWLPLPPAIFNSGPFSPSYSTTSTPLARSPGRTETPTGPGSCWKKGRLLARGTFGHVYLGFNSESGEMCATKEVTLFSDEIKSKESAQQLGQEIVLLSRLRHPNIVQYYGYETVDDKLYIYLEYVSGGSIHKLLQDYGLLGEIAIRSYTKQILSGLAYLHAKNTVHRDIKGANILFEPSGRDVSNHQLFVFRDVKRANILVDPSGRDVSNHQLFVFRDVKRANILVDPSGRVKLADFRMAKHVPIIVVVAILCHIDLVASHTPNGFMNPVKESWSGSAIRCCRDNYSSSSTLTTISLIVFCSGLVIVLLLVCFFMCVRRAAGLGLAPAVAPQGLDPHEIELFPPIRASQGLDPHEIELLPLIGFPIDIELGNEADECYICMEEFLQSDIIRMLPACRHVYHAHCIDPWISRNSYCPVCRHSCRLGQS